MEMIARNRSVLTVQSLVRCVRRCSLARRQSSSSFSSDCPFDLFLPCAVKIQCSANRAQGFLQGLWRRGKVARPGWIDSGGRSHGACH